jgi:transcriptional regulator with XRE-family HTH domain
VEARRAAIKAVQQAAGLSVEEWCKRAGLKSSGAVGNFLRGLSRSLSLSTLEPLARAADVSVSQLIGEEPLSATTAKARRANQGRIALPNNFDHHDDNDATYVVTIESSRFHCKCELPKSVVMQILNAALSPPTALSH